MQSSTGAETATGRRSRTPWIVAGIAALFTLMLVGGLGSLVWFGLDTFHDQAYTAIRADPGIVDALGTINDIQFDYEETSKAPGDDEFAYRIFGERANGVLVGRFVTVSSEVEDLRDGKLILSDGRVIAVGTARLD